MVMAPLFVPANRPDRFDKALSLGTDAVVLDLEDAVAAEDKDSARANIANLPKGRFILRCNAMGTLWHKKDLIAARSLSPIALMIPKAEDTDSLARLDFPLIPLIETARGLAEARQIAALPNVIQLAFGSLDFCVDMSMDHLREGLLPIRLELVLASRLAGISAPLDGVTTKLEAGLAAMDAEHAKSLGMGGKLCIHPMQLAEVNQVFAPSAEELDWAIAVLQSGDGVARVSNEMVDEPVRRRARTILERARQLSENGRRKIGIAP